MPDKWSMFSKNRYLDLSFCDCVFFSSWYTFSDNFFIALFCMKAIKKGHASTRRNPLYFMEPISGLEPETY